MINYENTRKVLSYNEMMNIYNKTDNFDIVDEEVYVIIDLMFFNHLINAVPEISEGLLLI